MRHPIFPLPIFALLCLCLASCADHRLSADLSLGANGLTVAPSVSGRLGGGTVSFTP